MRKSPILFEKANLKVQKFIVFSSILGSRRTCSTLLRSLYIHILVITVDFFLSLFCLPLYRGDDMLLCYAWVRFDFYQSESFLVNAIFIKPAQSASETPREMETYLNFWGLEIILQILYKNIENNYYLAAQFWNIWAHALFFWRSLILYRYELGMASKDDTSCDPTALPKLVSHDLLGSNELQCLSNLQIFNTFPHKVMMKTREASL